MKAEQVNEGNEVIEAFYIEQGGKPSMKEDIWFYESDWNMLMPVAVKIFSNGYDEEGFAIVVKIKRALSDADINATYLHIVQFITWYNSIKKA